MRPGKEILEDSFFKKNWNSVELIEKFISSPIEVKLKFHPEKKRPLAIIIPQFFDNQALFDFEKNYILNHKKFVPSQVIKRIEDFTQTEEIYRELYDHYINFLQYDLMNDFSSEIAQIQEMVDLFKKFREKKRNWKKNDLVKKRSGIKKPKPIYCKELGEVFSSINKFVDRYNEISGKKTNPKKIKAILEGNMPQMEGFTIELSKKVTS